MKQLHLNKYYTYSIDYQEFRYINYFYVCHIISIPCGTQYVVNILTYNTIENTMTLNEHSPFSHSWLERNITNLKRINDNKLITKLKLRGL